MLLLTVLGAAVLATGCVSRPRYRTNPTPQTPTLQKPNPPAKPPAAPAQQQMPPKFASAKGAYQIGLSSYYAHDFHGRPTASGEIFDMNGLSAAHRELPLGTIIRVTHMGNGRSVILKVNDRGPFVENRILDLSLGAARELGMIQEGVARVKIEIIKPVQ